MPNTKTIKVIKVPLSRSERPPDRPQAFPHMPRLYLELLENKQKIKQDLINTEYVPTENKYPNSVQPQQTQQTQQDRQTHKPTKEEKVEKYDEIKELGVNESNSVGSISSTSTPELLSNHKHNKHSIDSDSQNESGRSDSSRNESDNESRSDNTPQSSENSVGSERSESKPPKPDKDDDELSVRLKQLLADTDDESSRNDSRKESRSVSSVISVNSSVSEKNDIKKRIQSLSTNSEASTIDKYSRRYKSPLDVKSVHRTAPAFRRSVGGMPPTLEELQQQGQVNMNKELRDVNFTTMNEQQSTDKKREILFKFDLLRKSYPNARTSIPEFTIHSDLTQMQKDYDSTVRRLSLDSTVENYKQYLIGGFMLTEFVFGNFLGFDMQGFTQQQIVSMSSYERLLIELGEKSYVPKGSKWPVELRLLFMIIMNAAFFIVSKLIMRKTGANLMNMINGMNGMNNTTRTTAAPARKRRMRGPTINLDDIPEVSGGEQQINTTG